MQKQDSTTKKPKHSLKWKVKTTGKVVGGLAAIALAKEALLDRRYFSHTRSSCVPRIILLSPKNNIHQRRKDGSTSRTYHSSSSSSLRA